MIRARALQVVLVLVGLVFTAAVYPVAMDLWRGDASDTGDTMMMSLYFTLGIFLLLAACNPSAHRSVIAFAFPRFRSFRRYDSITFPSYGDGCRWLEDGKLRIQGTGLVKVKLHRPVEGEIKTVTIKRDVNHWYVCFSVERDSVALPESSEDIGMAVGLDSFVALSNGMEIDNPRHLKRGLAHLRRAQRRLPVASAAATAAARPPHSWPRRTV